MHNLTVKKVGVNYDEKSFITLTPGQRRRHRCRSEKKEKHRFKTQRNIADVIATTGFYDSNGYD
jgi:hypothetical protein